MLALYKGPAATTLTLGSREALVMDLKHRYCIVGIGDEPYGSNAHLSQLGHIVMAIHAALRDAGLTVDDVDGLITEAPTSSFPMLWAPRVAEAIGLVSTVAATIDHAGPSNVGLIQHAISAIELGQADVVVCASSRRGGGPRGFEALAGLFGAPQFEPN